MFKSVLETSLGCRCPRCGEGRLFSGYLQIVPACDHCGLSFAGSDTADGPAFFVMMPLSIVTAVLALLFEVHAQPPLWEHMVIWPLFIAVSIGVLLRPVKAFLVALQYRVGSIQRAERNTWV